MNFEELVPWRGVVAEHGKNILGPLVLHEVNRIAYVSDVDAVAVTEDTHNGDWKAFILTFLQ